LALTGGVGELILLALYAVLQSFGVATSYLDALLNGLGIYVRHVDGVGSVLWVSESRLVVIGPLRR
jgi:hypothetical protein